MCPLLRTLTTQNAWEQRESTARRIHNLDNPLQIADNQRCPVTTDFCFLSFLFFFGVGVKNDALDCWKGEVLDLEFWSG